MNKVEPDIYYQRANYKIQQNKFFSINLIYSEMPEDTAIINYDDTTAAGEPGSAMLGGS